MSQLNIEMPPDLENWVEARVAGGRYTDAGEYLRALIRSDQELEADDLRWLQGRYAQSLASGVIEAEPEDIIEQIIAEIPGDDD
jgi:antitoxin ParD1/3/4